jgi:hypothetical protein
MIFALMVIHILGRLSLLLQRKLILQLIMYAMLGGIPVPTAWRVLGLRMEERPPDMEVSCEYIE